MRKRNNPISWLILAVFFAGLSLVMMFASGANANCDDGCMEAYHDYVAGEMEDVQTIGWEAEPFVSQESFTSPQSFTTTNESFITNESFTTPDSFRFTK